MGEGEPIVILHGLFGMLDNWKSIGRVLAQKYMVFLVDLRNHGRSPHDDEMHYRIMAEDVAHLMEAQWIYQATVIGHSMGGKVAMQLALDYPELVSRLVVVDIAPRAYQPHHQDVVNALSSLNLSTVTTRQQIQDQMDVFLDDASTKLFLMKNIKRDGDQFEWKMNRPVLLSKYANINVAIASDMTFDGPVLFVAGGNSDYISDADIEDAREMFPEAHLVRVEGAGHWVHADAPEQLLDILKVALSGGDNITSHAT